MAEERESHSGLPPTWLSAFWDMLALPDSEWWQQLKSTLEPFGLTPSQVVEQVSICVNTRTDIFASWIRIHTSPEFLVTGGWPGTEQDHRPLETVLSLGVDVAWENVAGPIPIRAIVQGYLVGTSKGKQGPSPIKIDLENLGRIDIIPLASDRSEVTINSWFRECHEFFEWLLEEIVQRWPEAGKQRWPETPPEANGQHMTGKRGPQAGTLFRVAEARKLILGGLTRTKAFEMARTDSRTYDNWVETLIGWEEDSED